MQETMALISRQALVQKNKPAGKPAITDKPAVMQKYRMLYFYTWTGYSAGLFQLFDKYLVWRLFNYNVYLSTWAVIESISAFLSWYSCISVHHLYFPHAQLTYKYDSYFILPIVCFCCGEGNHILLIKQYFWLSGYPLHFNISPQWQTYFLQSVQICMFLKHLWS